MTKYTIKNDTDAPDIAVFSALKNVMGHFDPNGETSAWDLFNQQYDIMERGWIFTVMFRKMKTGIQIIIRHAKVAQYDDFLRMTGKKLK